MRIARGRAGAPSEKRAGTFTGDVWGDPILPSEDGVTVNAVFFEPGGRTHWHSHDVGQVLHVTHGQGYLQCRDGSGTTLLPGDVAHIGPGEEHWHGAAPSSYLLHVAVSLGGYEWLEPVSDEDYARAFEG
jgi:quercetin dioxygenase-like cupin family protein